jgi:hypothetical protein
VFGQTPKGNTLVPVSEFEEMQFSDLPETVRSVLAKDEYAGMKIDKIYKVGKRKAQREDQYTIRFKTEKDFIDVYLNDNGNVIDPQDSDNKSGE